MGHFVGMTDYGDDDSNIVEETEVFGHSHIEDENPEPHVGMEFASENAAKIFYLNYARNVGFNVRIYIDQLTTLEFLCSKDLSGKRPGENCGAKLILELKDKNKWVVSEFVKEHSHTIVGDSKLHCNRPKRHFTATRTNMGEDFFGVDIVPSGMMHVSLNGSSVSTEMNHAGKSSTAPRLNHTVKNFVSLGLTPEHSNRRTFGKDAQNLLDYFKKMQAENPGFYYAIQLDGENRMANAFWADSRSRTAYNHFGDAVGLDTTCIINQYTVPFAPFTGVNHHGQSILFGCALLLDESEDTFVWLFKTFLACMSERAPVSLTTAKDKSIQAAVAQVFPETCHSVNKWHVLREGQDRMARVCLVHPNFQVELYNCINMTDTIEEFESSWMSIIQKYDLKRNEWLQSVFDSRMQWVPVYFRDSFFADLFPSLRYESSFFDGYVNQQTTLAMFFRQYERALESSFEREVEADFESICDTPVLRTPSPMEKQAASLYTKRIFLKFQEELVETFVYTANRVDGDGHNSMFRVAKFEDDHKICFVSLNNAEMKANCSCKMFEYSGILCRHILTVFTVTNVLTLPSNCILKRWTRNAKTTIVGDEQSKLQGHESFTSRYNNLCKEAIKFAEDGAISLEAYSAALVSLREGEKKVAGVKISVAKLSSSSQVIDVASDRRTSMGNPGVMPLIWPRQDETLWHFNLNSAGVSNQRISDPNVSHISPISLIHDGGHTDNMLMLPCLKSMTWAMKNTNPANKLAVINLKLQNYGKTPAGQSEVKFSPSKVTLEPMLRSMADISEQLSTPVNKVAVINLKLQNTNTTSGESEVKFQVSRDTLGAMLRSMAYIREQLLNAAESKQDTQSKRQRK